MDSRITAIIYYDLQYFAIGVEQLKVDMHIHTTASDGSWSAAELIAEVVKQDIGLFAVTDHDTVDNIASFLALKGKTGRLFLPGVEVCTTYKGQSFHILGYGVDHTCAELLGILRRNTRLLEERDDDCIKALAAEGIKLEYDEYLQYENDRGRGGWKALNFLIDKGVCAGVEDFFSRVFTKEKGMDFPEFPAPAEVITAIAAAGGTPILAHPGSAFHRTVLSETLDFFANQDIKGVECFHSSHNTQTTKQALEWCRKNDMLITGGSDCHGSFVPGRHLGVPEIAYEQLRLGDLLEKAVEV